METSEEVLGRLRQASGLYHRLLLIVGIDPSEVSRVLGGYAEIEQSPLLSFSDRVASALLDTPMRQRPLEVRRVAGEVVDGVEGDVVFLDRTDLIFLPGLDLDPLALLKSLARNKVVVAAWNGAVDRTILTHAVKGHPEYQSHEIDDFEAITVG